MIPTYQDFERETDKIKFICNAVTIYRNSDEYRTALLADEYEAQKNTTISEVVKTLYSAQGKAMNDFTASNNRIASNFFHRLNTQRVTYSLGNGVTFTMDNVKDRFTDDFDTTLSRSAMRALEHGADYLYLNDDGGKYRIYSFSATEFVPLYDEYDGSLKAGIRFWSLDWNTKPGIAVLYEEDGYTRFRSRSGKAGLYDIEQDGEKQAYRLTIRHTDAGGDEVVGAENYSGLPVVPLYGNERRESTLVGLRSMIDSYDLIMSGFANDLEDCAQVYWLIGNAMGMSDGDLEKFRDRLKFTHIATADLDNSSVTPYTQDIPHTARVEYLQMIEAAIYSHFGAFNVKQVSAGASTATEINASYQPMDEEADAFEYQIIECVQQILKLIGLEDTPTFKRNRISNQAEQVQMLANVAQYLDDKTILKNIPFISVDEIDDILANKYSDTESRFEPIKDEQKQGEEEQEEV